MTLEEKRGQTKLAVRDYFRIFVSTLKIGLFTFGGGYSMIPLIRAEFVEKNGWISDEDMSDIVALSPTLPGMVALNVSLLTGYKMSGTLAGIVAGIGIMLPSYVVLCIISMFYNAFMDNPFVIGFLRGVSGAVVALFVSTIFTLSRKNVKDWIGVGIFVCSLLCVFLFPGLNVIFIILGACAVGIIAYCLLLPKKGGKT